VTVLQTIVVRLVEGTVMPTVLPAPVADPSHLAVAGFLARYREPTASAYRRDLRCFWLWCADRDLSPLAAKRPHIELYLRDREQRGYAPATISRRLSTVAGLFKYAVIDEHLPTNPTLAVTRPRVPWEGQRRTVLHPLEFAAVLSAARQHGPTAHALVALLGMLGLRVSKACQARIEDLRYSGGYELLRVLGKGAKPAEIPLPIPVLRAVKAVIEGRTRGPILLSARQTALTRGAASRLLARVVRAAGVTSPASPHTLRRTFCPAGLISGVPLRDTQYAMRHADARTTIRYDMARANLDRHAAHSVAAYLAGMAVG
jgi:integrase/recombinase XerD